MRTVLIEAPYFCAAVIAVDGRVVAAAPIIHYMIGWNGQQVRDYCRKKGWSWRA